MTTKPKARRFRLRRDEALPETPRDPAPARPAPQPAASGQDRIPRPAPQPRTSVESDSLFDETPPAQGAPHMPARPAMRPSSPAQAMSAGPQHAADVTGSAAAEAEIDAIRAEGLTGRQMRMAMRVAQKHGIKATSALDAVRLLRRQGIDPFERAALLDIVQDQAAPAARGATAPGAAPGGVGPAPQGTALVPQGGPQLPKAHRQPGPPAQVAPGERASELAQIQANIARRRKRRIALLLTRLTVFVTLPTLLAGWYFFVMATDLFATKTEFVIQQADSQQAGAGGGMGGLFAGSGLATAQDSVTVQSYLQSREAMRRLDAEHGFKAHFQSPGIDPLRRLALDTTDEAAYRLYKRHVQISFDPTEGIIRMEVIAADPETSERFSRALVQYAEEQVDQLTQRLRANQMRDARESFEEAEARMLEAQMRVLDLQERFQVLSSEVEVTLLTQQITTLEAELNQSRLSFEDLMANPRPNPARLEQTRRRIAALEGQIAGFRAQLTQGADGQTSIARIQRELVIAEADVQTRQLLLQQALTQMEAARIEANRQVRYLSMGVSPIAPDEPTYPRKFENTFLSFLVFSGIYLMISMTSSILREQVSS
jgi:capsular polysaccharide transport system permease protein